MTIGIIGAGNMGTALCKAFIHGDVTTEDKIFVCDLNDDKLAPLKESGINTSKDFADLLKCDLVLIAVKPQGFSDLALQLKGKIHPETIVLSIMAAVNIHNIQQKLDHQRVVRCMPNTPALIQEGVIAWVADASLSEDQKSSTKTVLESAGYVLELSSEEQLDEFATLAGSGPGFFYALIEAWRDAAKETLHLPEEKVEELLLRTLSGSLKLADSSDKSLSELRQQVTSKGGITAAGLEVLQEAKLKETFSDMFQAALKRTQELNN